jgi:hypothetical protein
VLGKMASSFNPGALMDHLFSSKRIAAAVFGLGALLAASAAQARSDVYLSIGVPVAPVYSHPAPVYVQPQPVYVQPRPVYVQPAPVYVQPQPVYAPRHGRWHQGWEGRGGYHQERRHAHRYGPYGDLDRDGVRNQDDRDRDGDGIRNRHDRVPNDRFRY